MVTGELCAMVVVWGMRPPGRGRGASLALYVPLRHPHSSQGLHWNGGPRRGCMSKWSRPLGKLGPSATLAISRARCDVAHAVGVLHADADSVRGRPVGNGMHNAADAASTSLATAPTLALKTCADEARRPARKRQGRRGALGDAVARDKAQPTTQNLNSKLTANRKSGQL